MTGPINGETNMDAIIVATELDIKPNPASIDATNNKQL